MQLHNIGQSVNYSDNEGLSSLSKIELIEKLSKSLRADASSKSAEEITRHPKPGRKFRKKKSNFNAIFTWHKHLCFLPKW